MRELTERERALGFQTIDPPEVSRMYLFEGGNRLDYHNVWALAVRESGNHRLMCDEGLVIVGGGWLAIVIDAQGWDF